MINLESLDPTDSELEPTQNINHRSLYLLPIQEHHDGDDASAAEIFATKETVNSIAESISVLTDLLPDQRNGSIYCKQKTVGSPFGGMVRVSKYGFFDPTVHDSPSKRLYLKELQPRVAGVEIHHPISVTDEGEIEHIIESFLIEKDSHQEYTLHALMYDNKTDCVDTTRVGQQEAIELLALLQILHSNE